MMMSPGSILEASAITVSSVGLPAGTITQAARGFESFLTKSSRELEPVAPSFTKPSTFAGVKSKATHLWPLRMRRLAMLPPILPRPIIPICILLCSLLLANPFLELRKRLLNRFLKCFQTGRHVGAEMDSQRAAVAVRENLEITSRLRCLYHAERVLLTRHGEICGVVAGDLQEDAGVRTALVGLPRGMEEPRAEAEAGGDFFLVAHGMANRLELGFVRVVHMDVAEHGEIIAGFDAAEMRLDVAAKRGVTAGGLLQRRGVLLVRVELHALVGEDGSFRGKRAVLFVLGGEFPSGDLAGFDVRLVERIDADDRTSDGGSDFPAQHFLAQLVNVRHGDA